MSGLTKTWVDARGRTELFKTDCQKCGKIFETYELDRWGDDICPECSQQTGERNELKNI